MLQFVTLVAKSHVPVAAPAVYTNVPSVLTALSMPPEVDTGMPPALEPLEVVTVVASAMVTVVAAKLPTATYLDCTSTTADRIAPARPFSAAMRASLMYDTYFGIA